MFLRVDTIFLPVTDIAEAREFYAMTIGLPELFDEEDFVGFAIGDTTLVLDEVEEVLQGTDISVVVESLEASINELKERGIEVEEPGGAGEPVDLAVFEDPYGNRWTLVQE